jgi:ribosomal protein L12E/L44/L45/RPP1/RPP2
MYCCVPAPSVLRRDLFIWCGCDPGGLESCLACVVVSVTRLKMESLVQLLEGENLKDALVQIGDQVYAPWPGTNPNQDGK